MEKMLRLGSIMTAGLLVALLAATGSPARAEVLEETALIEVFAGSYDPDPEGADDDTSFGVRLGFNTNPHFSFIAELSTLSSDGDFSDPGPPAVAGDFDYDLVSLDFSFYWNIDPEGRWVTSLYGGVGFSFVELDAEAVIEDAIRVRINGLEDDSVTFHAGASEQLWLTERFYVRANYRLRFIEDRDDDETDTEVTVAAGWRLGG